MPWEGSSNDQEHTPFSIAVSQNHRYTVIGGEEWKKLQQGTVNTHGLAIAQWVTDRRREYEIPEP